MQGSQNTQGSTWPGSSWARGQGHAGRGGSRSSRVVHAVWVPCGPRGVGRVSCVAGSAMTKDPAWQLGGGRGAPQPGAPPLPLLSPRGAADVPRQLLREPCQVAGRSETLPPPSWVSLCWAPRGPPRPSPEVRQRKRGLGLLLGRRWRFAGNTRAPPASSSTHTPKPPSLTLLSCAQEGPRGWWHP